MFLASARMATSHLRRRLERTDPLKFTKSTTLGSDSHLDAPTGCSNGPRLTTASRRCTFRHRSVCARALSARRHTCAVFDGVVHTPTVRADGSLLIVDKLPEDSYEHSVSPSSHGKRDAGTPTSLTTTLDSSQHPADEHTSLLP